LTKVKRVKGREDYRKRGEEGGMKMKGSEGRRRHEVGVTMDGACVFLAGENMITQRINAYSTGTLRAGFCVS